MSTMMAPTPANLMPAQGQQLAKNPMLPQLPNTGDLDSQYLAEEAMLRANVAREYADILQQLGWVDEAGNFMPGSVSVRAGRQASELQRQSDLAAEDVTNAAQQTGTLFSGRRAEQTAKAMYPYQQQIATLGVETPLALGGLYEQASGLIDQYTLQNNLLLANMAQRRAAAIAQRPAGAPGPGGGGGGESEAPPAEWNPPDYGPAAGYQPAGEVTGPNEITAPGGGEYTSGGGDVYYQSNQGPYKKKPMY